LGLRLIPRLRLGLSLRLRLRLRIIVVGRPRCGPRFGSRLRPRLGLGLRPGCTGWRLRIGIRFWSARFRPWLRLFRVIVMWLVAIQDVVDNARTFVAIVLKSTVQNLFLHH
jgi:hypothetical protein